MKSGANFIDQRKINDMYAEGKKAEEISSILGIELAHVQTYKPKRKKKADG